LGGIKAGAVPNGIRSARYGTPKALFLAAALATAPRVEAAPAPGPKARPAKVGAAHGALGAARAGQGKCAEALPELKIALEADPADATALEARKACGR
jgi:hypothetical protein